MTENDKTDIRFICSVLDITMSNKYRAKLIKEYFDGKYNLKEKEKMNELQRTEKSISQD